MGAKTMLKDYRSKDKLQSLKEKNESQSQLAEINKSNELMINELKRQLAEQDEKTAALSARLEDSAAKAQREQKLMVTAFYEAGLELQRLKAGNRTSSTKTKQTKSFLQRQRATHVDRL